jgi:hypothetical protein
MTSQIASYNAVIEAAVKHTINNNTMFESIVASLDLRLAGLEAASSSLEETKRDIIALGLGQMTQIFQPITDDILDILAEAEARLAGLEGGNIFADHILTLAISTFEGTTAQQALEELFSRTAFIGEGLNDLAEALVTAETPAAMADVMQVLPLTGGTLTGALTLGLDPTSPMHATTKQYVDGLSSGLAVKAAVKAASTANINLAAPGATIDGMTMVAADTFLAKDQTLPAQNGKYVWNGAAVPATRSTDMDAWSEVVASVVSVSGGTVNANSVFAVSASPGGTIGTTAMPWNKFGSFQPLNDKTTSFAGLAWAADKTAYWNGTAFVLTGLTTIGRSVAGAADAAAVRTAIGLGTAAVQAASSFAPVVHTHVLSDITDAAAALATKADANANLAALAGLTLAADKLPYGTGAGAMALANFTATGRTIAGAANAAAVRTALSLAQVATTGAFADLVGNISNGQLPVALAALYGLTPAANKIAYFSSGTGAALADFTAQARTFLAATSQAAQQAALGLASVAIAGTVGSLTNIGVVGLPLAVSDTPTAARTALGIDAFFNGISGGGDPVPGSLETPQNQIRLYDGNLNGVPGLGVPPWMGMCFIADGDTGIIRPGANRFGIVAGGELVGDFNATSATFAKGIGSLEITIPDQDARSFVAPNSCIVAVSILNALPSGGRPFGLFAARVTTNGTGTTPQSIGFNNLTNVDFRDVPMGGGSGAAGTVGKVSFSCGGDGKIYCQNRLGADLTFRFLIIGAA